MDIDFLPQGLTIAERLLQGDYIAICPIFFDPYSSSRTPEEREAAMIIAEENKKFYINLYKISSERIHSILIEKCVIPEVLPLFDKIVKTQILASHNHIYTQSNKEESHLMDTDRIFTAHPGLGSNSILQMVA